MAFSYIKVETTLNFKKDKPTVYKIAQQTIPPVTFNQMVADISEACGVNTTMSRAVVEGLINRLCHFMELGHAVQMGDFGTFKPVFTVKTQKSKDELGTDNVTSRKIRFYPGKRFKDMLKRTSFVSMNASSGIEEDGTDNPSGGGSGDGGTDFE